MYYAVRIIDISITSRCLFKNDYLFEISPFHPTQCVQYINFDFNKDYRVQPLIVGIRHSQRSDSACHLL